MQAITSHNLKHPSSKNKTLMLQCCNRFCWDSFWKDHSIRSSSNFSCMSKLNATKAGDFTHISWACGDRVWHAVTAECGQKRAAVGFSIIDEQEVKRALRWHGPELQMDCLVGTTRWKHTQNKWFKSSLKTQAKYNVQIGEPGSLSGRAPDSWLKGCRLDFWQEQRWNFLLQCQHSVLTLISVSIPPLCYRSSM